MVVLLGLGAAGCFAPADSVSTSDYFIEMGAQTNSGMTYYDVGFIGNSNETDIPYAAYTGFHFIPALSFDDVTFIGVGFMLQAEQTCNIKVTVKCEGQELGSQTVPLKGQEKATPFFEFDYTARDVKARLTTAEQEHADAEPPEDGSEKTKYSQLRTDFFVIEVFGPPCRIDTLIFRVGDE